MKSELQDESEHLEEIKCIARGQIADLKQKTKVHEDEIMDAKKNLIEETTHQIYGSLCSPDSFEQLVELSQFATQISTDISLYENLVDKLGKLEKLISSPYFARIDFTYSGESVPERIYIGRHSLIQERDILVHDWRAPISSMFYRYGLGKASFKAPVGTISGTIDLKRQYEIRKSNLEYYIDVNMEILDEYLRRLLSKNASPQMKSIVETIQCEQDIVIRDAYNDVLIVQGVAGSGKTSVALHRIAYLMYRGLTDRIRNQDIIIISPNSVFERYIENVLPELGEERVTSFLIEELFESIPGMPSVQTRYELIEQIMLDDEGRAYLIQKSLEYKCSKTFVKILDKLTVCGEKLDDIISLYKRLFIDEDSLKRTAEMADIVLPDDISEIIEYTKENLFSSKLSFDDASAVAYLYVKAVGMRDYEKIRQVVVDEAQDYYYLHYKLMNVMFPNAKYTILGDINQTINKPEDMDLYDEILQVLNKKHSSLVKLEKSFRCTKNIIRFGAQVIGGEIDSFGRDGNDPTIIRLKNGNDVMPLIANAHKYIDEGHNSIGIICKSSRECKELYEKLKCHIDIKLFDQKSDGKIEGILVLPVYLAKGLEFDVALIWGTDSSRYGSETDRSLLFIACTRALHHLELYYWGNISPFCSV